MKYAVLSDIHSNLDAFERVLSDIHTAGVERILSLGDMIGYGAQPEEVIAAVHGHKVESILGNHELAVLNPGFLDWFNVQARRSLVQTTQMLTGGSLAFIRGLAPFLRIGDSHFVHGYPPESPLTYLFQADEKTLKRTFQTMDFRICFVGHTHDLECIAFGENGLSRTPLQKGKIRLDPGHRHILNIGSVGQPRDGNAAAKYIIWDPGENSVDLRFIPYDYMSAAEKIRAAGLPEVHARRLLPR
jgi:predicted phosphodiesterase